MRSDVDREQFEEVYSEGRLESHTQQSHAERGKRRGAAVSLAPALAQQRIQCARGTIGHLETNASRFSQRNVAGTVRFDGGTNQVWTADDSLVLVLVQVQIPVPARRPGIKPENLQPAPEATFVPTPEPRRLDAVATMSTALRTLQNRSHRQHQEPLDASESRLAGANQQQKRLRQRCRSPAPSHERRAS